MNITPKPDSDPAASEVNSKLFEDLTGIVTPDAFSQLIATISPDHLLYSINRETYPYNLLQHLLQKPMQNWPLVEILLQQPGWSINAPNSFGRTPLHKLIASNAPTKAIRKLIDAKAIIDSLDKDGNTPLHTAVINANKEAVQILLENGANCDIQVTTALVFSLVLYIYYHPCSMMQHKEKAVQLLLEHAATFCTFTTTQPKS